MSEHLWYFELLNELHGPVSTDHIQQMVTDGQLVAEDRIRMESSEEWITVTDLKTLVENVASGEDEWEEVTDLDDLNFTFEDSSAGVARATHGSDSEQEEIDDRHSGLDIDSFQLIGDPEEARHSAFKSVANQSNDSIWLVQSLGQQLGPMAMPELLGMAEAGAIAGTDQVRKQDQDNWVNAESIPEIAASLAQAAAGASAASPSQSKKSAGSASTSGSKQKSKPSSQSAAAAPGRKRRRKKKRSQKDQLLAEIFSDVFADDGKVRDLAERPDLVKPANQPSANQPSANPTAAASMNSAMDASPAVGSPGSAPGFAPGSSPGMAAASTSGYPAASPGMQASAAGAAGSFVPPGKPKKKRGGGGGGVSMPEAPVLAAIAGGLLVALLGIGAYLGWFTIPGLGVNSEAFFTEFETEFPKIMTKNLPSVEWDAFRIKFLTDGRAIAKSSTASAGTDPAAAKSLNKALLIIRIMDIKQTEVESRKKTWDKYLTL